MNESLAAIDYPYREVSKHGVIIVHNRLSFKVASILEIFSCRRDFTDEGKIRHCVFRRRCGVAQIR